MTSDAIITDGAVDFSGGIDSNKVTTIQSERNPNGLARNQLAWMDNCTCRDGGITQRFGFQKVKAIHNSSGLFQGKFMYDPIGEDPYEIYSISGHIYLVRLDGSDPIDLTALAPGNSPQFNPADQPIAFFVQAERFLIIQAGDGVTLPFFWDGSILRRSAGFAQQSAPPPAPVAATPQTFYFTIPLGETWTVPVIAASATVDLHAPYGGAIGDRIDFGGMGTYDVTGIAGNTITIQAVAPNYAGQLFNVGNGSTNGTVITTIIPIVNPPLVQPPPDNELPAATAMDYFMGRVWYAQDRQVSAGDIVKGSSGTAFYEFDDSVLKVTENPMILGGDGFTIPSSDGNVIRGIRHSANIDAALGQGRLFVGTRKAIYALNVPVTRNDWIAATNSNQPLMTVVQLNNGWVNDRSIVAVNGDLFYQSLEPGIRSLNQSTRFFGQWANIQISANEERILKFNDRSLLRFSSGIYFDNRLLQTALPKQFDQGVAHQALIPLDFDPISSFNRQVPPNWEGMYEGINILQMNTGDFGGRERAFATTVSQDTASPGEIQLWEITRTHITDNVDSRVSWVMEFPAFTWGDETVLKKLVGAEIWIDRLRGKVDFFMEWRPDGQACWIPWHQWSKCSTKNSNETVQNPSGYPLVNCLESYFSNMALPKPPDKCASATGRPAHMAYQIQPRLVIKGFCRVRAIYLHAEKMQRKLYDVMTC